MEIEFLKMKKKIFIFENTIFIFMTFISINSIFIIEVATYMNPEFEINKLKNSKNETAPTLGSTGLEIQGRPRGTWCPARIKVNFNSIIN